MCINILNIILNIIFVFSVLKYSYLNSMTVILKIRVPNNSNIS